jgi:predicted protein tyrosine phosphatase
VASGSLLGHLTNQCTRMLQQAVLPVISKVRTIHMKHVLFVCSQNRLRSPTAEKVFFGRPEIEVASAGLNPGAVNQVSSDLIEWADVVFVMEAAHRNKLSKKFRAFLTSQRVICLDIPDDYEYMDPELIKTQATQGKKSRMFITRMELPLRRAERFTTRRTGLRIRGTRRDNG